MTCSLEPRPSRQRERQSAAAVIYAFIEAEKATFPIAFMRPRLGVSRAGFYEWRTRQHAPAARTAKDRQLTDTIRQIHRQSRGIYGAPRVHAELVLGMGIRVGRKRVARLMRADGLVGVTRRRRRGCTRRDIAAIPSDDRVTRAFDPEGPDQLWVADIERHEASLNRAVVKGHRLGPVAAGPRS